MTSLKSHRQSKTLWVMVLIGAFVFYLSSVSAGWSNNTFNNSLTTENLTFGGNENRTKYLQIPSSISALTKGYLNLSGLRGVLIENTTYINYYCSNNTGAINVSICFNPNGNYTNAFDKDWITNYTFDYGLGGGAEKFADLYFNFSIPSNIEFSKYSYLYFNVSNGSEIITNIKTISIFDECYSNSTRQIAFRYRNSGRFVGIWRTQIWVDCYNYTSNLFTQPTQSGLLYFEDNGGSSQNYKLHESKLILYDASDFPFNISLSIENQMIFNNSGNFTTNNRTSNLASTINRYLNATYLVGTNYLIPFIFHSDTAGILQYLDMLFSNEGFLENSQIYNNQTYSGQRESFLLNLTYDSNYYIGISSKLIYNNTEYTSVQIGSGNNLLFNATLFVPSVQSQTNKTFYWRIALTNSSNDISYFNSTFNNQTINLILIDNCSSYSYQILNFSLFDEDTRAILNGTIEVLVNLLNQQRTLTIATFNKSYSVTNGGTARVCFDNLNSTRSLDYQAKYYGNTSTYALEYKFAQAIQITNSTPTQNINLYSLLDARSTTFTITLQSPDLSIIEGAVIDIQRQYLPINQFLSIESPITNNIGEAIAHLVHNEEYYNFVVSKDGVLLGTFNNYLVQCQNFVTGDCRINLNLIQSTPDIGDFNEYGNITGSFTWQRSARNLFFNFLSADGLSHNVTWFVIKMDNFGNDTICSFGTISTSGTFQCSIPVSYGNTTVLAKVYSDGIFLGNNFFSLSSTASSIFGGTRVILGMLMYTTLTLMLIAHPVMIILGSMLGIIFAVMFRVADGGTFGGNGLILLWFIIAGGIIIYYMRNKI